jgi:hypothetical protein
MKHLLVLISRFFYTNETFVLISRFFYANETFVLISRFFLSCFNIMSNDHKIPSISLLHHEKNVKENSKMDIFNIVLNRVIEKITFTNRQTDKTYIIFEVPKILIGYPNYDMKSCILFIINKLSQHSYLVEFIEPFYLYIDWGSKSTRAPVPTQMKGIGSFKTKDPVKLQAQTKALLSKFPDTSQIEFVYEDTLRKKKPKSKK